MRISDWSSDVCSSDLQISVVETVGLEGRVGFYDGAGALRDMVQNHMLQLLAFVAMEPPSSYNAQAIRDEKVKVLRELRRIPAEDVKSQTVAGQYRSGAIERRSDEQRVGNECVSPSRSRRSQYH